MHAKMVGAHEGGSAALPAPEAGIFLGCVGDVRLIGTDGTIGSSIADTSKGSDVGRMVP
jgi:hypothetical protein